MVGASSPSSPGTLPTSPRAAGGVRTMSTVFSLEGIDRSTVGPFFRCFRPTCALHNTRCPRLRRVSSRKDLIDHRLVQHLPSRVCIYRLGWEVTVRPGALGAVVSPCRRRQRLIALKSAPGLARPQGFVTVRLDPVLPRWITRYFGGNGTPGPSSTDTCLANDGQGREGCMSVTNVECSSLAGE